MTDKIKVIVKRPDEKIGHIEEIRNERKAFQSIVGGKIEPVVLADGSDRIMLICNDEGKLYGLPENFWFQTIGRIDLICGTAIICGDSGEDFTDCPIDLDTWQRMLKKWENI